MRITRFIDDTGAEHLGLDRGDGSADLLTGELLGPGPLEPTGATAPIARRLAPLIPAAILCIGRNYAEHARETGSDVPDRPVLFMKNPAALNHPDAPIVIPPICLDPPQVDFECELAVVIGKPAKNVSRDHALDHVLGYTIGNDVSARHWQKQWGASQWIRGKSFDTFCPLGPVLLTADEIPDPQSLTLTTTLNGQTMQHDTTANMIFPVADLIAILSEGMTLLPGAVIMTGTPSGVGVARDPQVFLKPGDTIQCAIDPIGNLTNPVTAE